MDVGGNCGEDGVVIGPYASCCLASDNDKIFGSMEFSAVARRVALKMSPTDGDERTGVRPSGLRVFLCPFGLETGWDWQDPACPWDLHETLEAADTPQKSMGAEILPAQ
ncbi:hypothetical protein PM082_009781 [Marasmius tenuissimus]|nr:hypothetical protein PM082_009781 [Marasmius tenuissimus]